MFLQFGIVEPMVHSKQRLAQEKSNMLQQIIIQMDDSSTNPRTIEVLHSKLTYLLTYHNLPSVQIYVLIVHQMFTRKIQIQLLIPNPLTTSAITSTVVFLRRGS